MIWLKNKSNQIVESPYGGVDGSAEITWQGLSRCSTEQARKLLPYKTALALDVLPLGVITLEQGALLTLAALKGVDPKLSQTVQFLTEIPVKLIPVESTILRRAIFAAYNQSEDFLDHYQSEGGDDSSDLMTLDSALTAPNGEGATLLAKLINYSISREATDLMIIPNNDGISIYLKIHGELYSHSRPLGKKHLTKELLNRIKVLANLDTTNRFTPQDGRIIWQCAKEQRSIRVHTVPTLHGEKAVLRILGSDRNLSIDDLGIDPEVRELVGKYLVSSRGALLVGGATASGKSTTLYAVIRALALHGKHVVTIEDPIEAPIAMVSQSEIDLARAYDYPVAIKAALRQGPDVLMIGELRDGVSAVTAMQGALAGHQLLTTVHGGDVFEMLLRIKHFGVDQVTLASAVRLVLCQRLIPKLCQHCKKSSKRGCQRGPGCKACAMSGLSGRALVVEALEITAELRELLIDGEFTASQLRSAVTAGNYIGIESQIKQLIKQGVIDELPKE